MALKFFIRNLGKHAEGYWIAEVAAMNEDAPAERILDKPISYQHVHRKFGSWMVGHDIMKQVKSEAAAELQRQVRKLEKQEHAGD